MKETLKLWMLAIVLIVSGQLSLTSCSDDDDDSKKNDIETIADKVWAFSQSHPDGFTLDIRTMKEPTAGIAVAYAATQGSHSRSQLGKVIEHAQKNGGYVGGWLDTTDGEYYFDSVRLFPEDQLALARQFAIDNEQLAFFIISTGTEIRLDGEDSALPAATRSTVVRRTYAPTWKSAAYLRQWSQAKRIAPRSQK